MPSPTPKAARFMALCATVKGRKNAHGKCPPIKVAREFTRHDAMVGILKGKRKR